jgi:hypothetical protein
MTLGLLLLLISVIPTPSHIHVYLLQRALVDFILILLYVITPQPSAPLCRPSS